ncbi:MAG: hypothetical protein BWX80_02359 [Candidatus Hydrogenedentes bacterium ADurb.Bin101]|nr:MAG: hypothetical protein BWX80_02359 [Candidatus Hydrogenedentes bacterium ADurb.Bin101]
MVNVRILEMIEFRTGKAANQATRITRIHVIPGQRGDSFFTEGVAEQDVTDVFFGCRAV